jgi:hypothetical protein
MSALENSVFIEILKKRAIFFTYIGEFLLKIFYYTPFKAPIYENH